MRVVFVQPSLASYRISFYVRLFKLLGGKLEVFYSGNCTSTCDLPWAYPKLKTKLLPLGFFWQHGVFGIPLGAGDIVVLSGNLRFLNLIPFIFICKLKSVKIVWWGHFWSASSSRYGLLARSIVMKLADALLFYTDLEIEEFQNSDLPIKFYGGIHALNNGVDVSKIITFRKKYSSRERGRNILFIGRLTKKSNLPLLLNALSVMQPHRPHLHIIGHGDEKNSLLKLALDRGVAGDITWYGALIDEYAISQIANRCSVFVYPGEVGLSLIHAMAYGLPAIVHSNRWKHMPEISAFKSDHTGCDFVQDNMSSLASTIDSLLGSQDLLDQYSARSIDLADNVYNTEQMANRFLALVEDLRV